MRDAGAAVRVPARPAAPVAVAVAVAVAVRQYLRHGHVRGGRRLLPGAGREGGGPLDRAGLRPVQRPKKASPPVECEISRRDHRGTGGRYAAEVALAQGWELRPADVRKEVRLWWSAASPPGERRGDRHGTGLVTALPRLARVR
ncbi:hypothetical protein [Streptomyces sp. BK208]|uniref:hypothetical protein n=1 Tax=Streptomyces sp. BK208 TaxID=2512150 RepID=UPI001FB9287D|nr:hypothetical protein [Streptomyces sp. BK208]